MRAFIAFILTLLGIQTQIQPVVPVAPVFLSPTPIMQSVYLQVPFMSQAPFGEWSDRRYQDACEETSVIMAMAWIKNEVLAARRVKEVIADMAMYQTDHFGSYVDTSAVDTVDRLFRGYFVYSKVDVKKIESAEDIVRELMEGRLVIVPTNGKLLGNPNFTHGGPDRHNLVVTGYDLRTKEFVTNDPGTRNGKNYRYGEKVLFGAVRDYPTGDHKPIVGNEKVMIVISKP